jgi:hypothetical protein
LIVPPPPVADPTHSLTVAFVTGPAAVVPELMLLVTVTLHVTVWAESLSDPLHWLMLVTIDVDLVTNVPLPGAQGPRVQSLVSVVTEPRWAPLMVLTTTTVQSMPVVAPRAPGPFPLHWLTEMVLAAWAPAAPAS